MYIVVHNFTALCLYCLCFPPSF